jgi:hypothetical protein
VLRLVVQARRYTVEQIRLIAVHNQCPGISRALYWLQFLHKLDILSLSLHFLAMEYDVIHE